jgi:hypothetical protein
MDDKTSSLGVSEYPAGSATAPKPRLISNRGRLPGAWRSLFNRSRLASLRSGEGVRLSGTRIVTDLAWRAVHDFAIERDTQQLRWHSGHVNAVLSEGAVAIVGAETGGVWVVNPLSGTGPITQQYHAISLSDDWDNPDVNSLAYVPGSTSEFFAGCANGGALYHVELDVTLGAMLPRRSTRIPLPFSADIVQVLVIAGLERIVLATGNGIWWSSIPQPASDATQYSFSRARGLPAPDLGFSGVSEGPDQTVVAAAWGADVGRQHYGIFIGKWDGKGLTFNRAAIDGLDETKMLRTSIDACAGDRRVIYAVAAQEDDTILGVLRSDDGGAGWTMKTTPFDHGSMGWYNNCIAVSPIDADTVALGWRKEGPFYSTDGASTWTHPHGDDDSNLHADNHAIHFARSSPTDALFVGSDGGVVRTRDFGQSYNSEYNRHLATLQFYENNFDVSSRFPGLMAGGTQDNGNVYCNLRAARPSWKQLEGGDGDYHRFIDALGVLLRYNNTLEVGPEGNKKEVGNRVRIAPWKPYAWEPTDGYFDGLGDVVPVDGNPDGLGFPLLEAVRSPSWTRNGMKMYAVAAEGIPGVDNGFNGRIFGFFANDDGSGATFSFLKDIGTGTMISSMGSFDGTRILIGTANGQLLTFDPGSGAVTDVTPTGYGSKQFKRIDVTAANRAFALHENGRLLHFDGTTWTNTSGWGLVTFVAEPRTGSRRVFAANDAKVYVSGDDGANWANASQGLPARPHCSDLRIGANAFGGHDLYLATYGRSVFVANIDYLQAPPIRPRLPEEVSKIIGAIPRDGPGVVFIFVNGQLVPLPPRGPLMDIVSALAIADVAEGMSPELRQRMRHAAFGAINEIAQRELSSGKDRG